jgi:anhydro-N-acetylmuramic acid kinase
MVVAGIMSGTSADGIEVALVRLAGRGWQTRIEFLAHGHYAFPTTVRRAILEAMNGRAGVADLARLSFLLGDLYSEAALKLQRRPGLRCELIGCHGQTVFHQGEPARLLEFPRRRGVTWQIGEAAVIAARCGVPVVSDFRPADMAAGGKGAPLVPFLDYVLYRHPKRGRIVQNLGGIGNLTAIPAGALPEQVIAFDTGPGNMVLDALAERFYGQPFDRGGTIARAGAPLEAVVTHFLRLPFFRQAPPRTAGREQFGREFVERFLRRCGKSRPQDIMATATLLTARSIAEAVRLVINSGNGCGGLSGWDGQSGRGGPFALLAAKSQGPTANRRFHDFIVSGGGVRNRTMMRMIAGELAPLGLQVSTTDEFGLPSAAKEAVAFAVLAHQTWRRLPGNLPSATGARRPAILGKISFPPR